MAIAPRMFTNDVNKLSKDQKKKGAWGCTFFFFWGGGGGWGQIFAVTLVDFKSKPTQGPATSLRRGIVLVPFWKNSQHAYPIRDSEGFAKGLRSSSVLNSLLGVCFIFGSNAKIVMEEEKRRVLGPYAGNCGRNKWRVLAPRWTWVTFTSLFDVALF